MANAVANREEPRPSFPRSAERLLRDVPRASGGSMIAMRHLAQYVDVGAIRT